MTLGRVLQLLCAGFGITAVGCDSCGGKTTSMDAAPDAPWTCGDPSAGPEVNQCDDATRAACQQWGQSLIQNGYAHMSCSNLAIKCVGGECNGNICGCTSQPGQP